MQYPKSELYFGVVDKVITGMKSGYVKVFATELKPGGCVYFSLKNWGSKHAPEPGEVVMFQSPHLSCEGNWVTKQAAPVTPEQGESVREEALARIGPQSYSGPFEEELKEYEVPKKEEKKKRTKQEKPAVVINNRIVKWLPHERKPSENN